MPARLHPRSETPASSRGHVLFEALLGLAVLGLGAVPLAMLGRDLAALVLPAWRLHLERAWRMQARAELVSAMLALERHALAIASFASAPGSATPAGQWPRPIPPPPARTRHWLTATSCAGLDLSRCVEVRATPVHVDNACGTLVLRSSGEWLFMPTASAATVPLPRES